jgi:hypothetical protein
MRGKSWHAACIRCAETHAQPIPAMDLNLLKSHHQAPNTPSSRPWQAGQAELEGGTWLFLEPPPHPGQQIQKNGSSRPPLLASSHGLEIDTSCTLGELADFIPPHDWIAAPLLKECCRSLLASSNLWGDSVASPTLPAGTLISLAASLDGTCTLWPTHGSPREIPVTEFISGNHRNSLAPDEPLQSIWLPVSSLRKHYTLRRFSLTASGRTSVLLVGTLCPVTGVFVLTVTAAMANPVRLVFPDFPSAKAVHLAINESVLFDHHLEDPYGSPMHRRHLTYHYAEKILQELTMI